jgi:hypothetical protein
MLHDIIRYISNVPGSSVGIATDYGLDGPGIETKIPGGGEIFRTRPDRPWGSLSLLYNEYRVFTWVKQPGRGADHPPPSSADVENEYSNTSTPPLGPYWPVIG